MASLSHNSNRHAVQYKNTGGNLATDGSRFTETCSVGKRLASVSKQNRSAETAWQAACKPPASNSKHLGEELSSASAFAWAIVFSVYTLLTNKLSYFLRWKCSFRAINIYKSVYTIGGFKTGSSFITSSYDVIMTSSYK